MSGAEVARRLWRLLEPYHAVVYFSPEVRDALRDAGLKGYWMGYFAGRAAPMGAVPAKLVEATFFNFHPAMVARAVPDAWSFVSPNEILAARQSATDVTLHRLLGPRAEGPEIEEAASLARAAAEAGSLAGRPLCAAWASRPWPSEPHLSLWHSSTLLREHRGDGHVAALVAAGLDGCEAHVSFAGTGAVPKEILRPNRGWSEADWNSAASRLRDRGWVDDTGQLTEDGLRWRGEIEDRTDALAAGPYAAAGDAATERLAELMVPLVAAITEGGGVPFPNPMGVS